MGGGFKRREHTEALLLPSTRDSQKCCQIVDAMFSAELLPQSKYEGKRGLLTTNAEEMSSSLH